ncbi:MAG: DMT family transporter [Bacteroidetes bacterium]|nr:DMT family transporter [Bacteroidota bacterium]MDA1333614.1 DMT family transporter [Bacteroidota bacterium]
MTSHDAHRGLREYLILGAGLLAISVSAILIRYAGDAPGEAVAVWRTVFASLLLLPVALVKSDKEIRAITKREWMLIVVSGIFLGLHFVTWISSLYHTNVASASTLVSLSPIFLAIMGFAVLGEKPRRIEIIAILTATAGTVALGWADQVSAEQVHGDNPLLGNGLALTAAALVSVYLLIGRHVRQRLGWLAYVAPLYVVTALTTWVVALLRDIPLTGYPMHVYVLCFGMAVIPQLIGHGSLNYVVRFFPAATIGLASLFEPVGASLLAFAFFGEVPSLTGAIAMIIILASVGWAMQPEKDNAS